MLFWVMVLLGVMILIHELGHYWAALACGVKVEAFSFGFGPRLFGFRRGETDFRVSAIPFGGYVRMTGEQAGDEKAADPRSFQAKARWQRAIVVFAGPLMNILLAIGIVAGLFMHAFPKEVDSVDPVISRIQPGSAAARAGMQAGDKIVQIDDRKDPTWQEVQTKEVLSAEHPLDVWAERKGESLHFTVTPDMDPKESIGVAGWYGEPDVMLGEVVPNHPAEKAGLKVGDLIVSVEGEPINSAERLQQIIAKSAGKPVTLVFLRDGHMQKATITPIANKETEGQWRIGVLLRGRYQIVKLPFGQAIVESAKWNADKATLIFQVLGGILEHRVSPKTIQGPIGMAKMSRDAAHEGPITYLALMSMVSLNLAIFNLLPIPILDGGVLLLLFIEMVIRRDVSIQVKETVFKLGFVFLMMIVVFVLYNDISKMFTNG